jgi:predicted nucleic-acid-binding Zn-ribbon protein
MAPKLICPKCGNNAFRVDTNAAVGQELNGRQIVVSSPVMVCRKCGNQSLTTWQADELARLTKKAAGMQKR